MSGLEGARGKGRGGRYTLSPITCSYGFTLIEMMLGASILSIVIVALLGSYLGQSFLNTNARNLTLAMNDATRVMEQIRQQNVMGQGTCQGAAPIPSAQPPAPYLSWNAWMNTGAPGQPKSIWQPTTTNRDAMELVVVTCQDGNSAAVPAPYCGSTNQTAANEWTPWYRGGNPAAGKQAGQTTTYNPIRVTVSIGWFQQGRAIGGTATGTEFTSIVVGCGKGCTTRGLAVGPDANNNGVLESQAMLTTLITCR